MKYTDLNKLPCPVFSRQDLKLLGVKVFDYQLSLWRKRGYIIKLKNGLYILASAAKKISPEEISSQLYAPSYVSLEKALCAYGIIPEMVYAVTCVTPKTTRRFRNKAGNFIYRHIKPSLFFGYRQIKTGEMPYLLAEPEKAFLDFLYLNLRKLKTTADSQEMRFNLQVLNKLISKRKLKKYLFFYKNEKMLSICKKLIGRF